MGARRIPRRINLKESHSAALDELISKDSKSAEDFIDEALDAYLEKKGLNPAANGATGEVPGTQAKPAQVPESGGNKPEKTSGAFGRQLEDLKTKARAGSLILLRIPTVQRLWDFSEKADIVIGKRTVSEVYDFKKFLSLDEDQVGEYHLLKAKLDDLRRAGLLIRSLEHLKEHSTVSISSGELMRGYDRFKDEHYAFVSCLDGTSALVKTAVLKTLRHKENVRKSAEVVVPCGETVVCLPGIDDADNFRLTFDALTNKLDRIADMIIMEYTPIDRKWSRLMDQQMAGLRLVHWVLQGVAGVLIFAAITYFYVTDPRVFFPAFYPTESIAGYRDFIAAYLFMLPAAAAAVNFFLIYVVWFLSTMAIVRTQVRRAIDRDMLQMKRSIEMELRSPAGT